MAKRSYYTHEGLAKLNEKIQQLKNLERPRLAEQIAEARAKGDLKENAEYHAAKEAQHMLELQIRELEHELMHAEVIDKATIDTTHVSIFNRVQIKDQQTGLIFTYTLVSPTEANLKEQKISVASPIGKGLVGKKVGDIITVDIPTGKATFQLLKISV